jgi:hypothetical protein
MKKMVILGHYMNYWIKRGVIGGSVYCLGDFIATFLLDDISLFRSIGIFCLGGILYNVEISLYFKWIEKTRLNLKWRKVTKSLLAAVFFNPVWIFRHFVFIKLFTFSLVDITFTLFITSVYSFVVNTPISLVGNYIIQNVITEKERFVASAIMSGLMAVSYALTEVYLS